MKREMNKQDKLYQNIKNAAQRQELQPYAHKERLWETVSEQLNPKKRKRMILYRTLSAAAVILVIVIVGLQYNSYRNAPHQIEIVNEDDPIIDNSIQMSDSQNVIVEDHSKEELKDATQLTLKKKESKQITEGESLLVNQEENQIEIKREKQVSVLDEIKSETESTSGLGVKSAIENVMPYDNPSSESESIKRLNTVAAKDFKINGTVVDDYALPLPGVDIIIKGSSEGIQTNFDGEFSIEVNKEDVLVFSYVGLVSQEVKIENDDELQITMEADSAVLSEVVVAAYSTRKKRRKARKQEKKFASPSESEVQYTSDNAIPLKSSQVAGIQINSDGYQDDSEIRIRGAASINTNNPLYIVNGNPVSHNTIKNLDPQDIKSLKVLKDMNATAIYGSRGKDGVVVILTKDATAKEKKAFDSLPKVSSYQVPTNEDYETYKENPFTSPLSEALSTFSIDVDRAAYTNIRRMINNGQEVPKDAVRIEEMLNYFEYDYDKPSGKDPFAIHTEYSDAPWNANHKLLRIALQGKDIPKGKLPASNLVFLIDVSGSMNSQNKLPLVKKSLNLLVDQMRDEDKIALVTYAGSSQVVLEPTSGNDKTKIKNAINQLSSGGGTYASEGIETAYKLAEEHFVKNGNNRVIIATDGDFNIGVTSNRSLEDLISEKRKTNIFLTCLGYGMGNYKDSKMQSLSQKGNGNYAYIDTYQEAQKFLDREFKGSLYAIAKDVKIQIEFNPKHVQSYRLIGYETRMLETKDFDDDAKDAGEIGVNHQVTALYEVVPHGVKSPYGDFKPNLKYQNVPKPNFNNYSEELATVKFRYKPPKEDKSIKLERIIKNKSVELKSASNDFKFTTAVAWFGLKLRQSKLISGADKQDIIDLAKEGLKNDADGYRAEFVRLVRLSE